MERALAFYIGLLGFVAVTDETLSSVAADPLGVAGSRSRRVRLRLGNEFLDLHRFLSASGRPIPADSRSNDLWHWHLSVVGPRSTARTTLMRDPDGHAALIAAHEE